MRVIENLADLPQEIPVFPLLGTILLPRATLPLQIFEPRYLAMVDAALALPRLIGIVQPVGEGGPTGSPFARAPLRTVGCIGRITSFQQVEERRYMIALAGIVRFHPAQEVALELPYRTFRIDCADFSGDLTEAEGEPAADRDKLLDVLKRFLAARGMGADWSTIEKQSDEAIVNGFSLALPFLSEEKQALLEAATLEDRTRALITLAEMALAAGDVGGGTPETKLQ